MTEKHTLISPLPEGAEAARAIAGRHGNRPEALLEIFHDLQDELGSVPEAALPILAKALNLSRAEVHGVVTFYHDFRRAPAGRHVVKVCQAESCQALGSRALAAAIQKNLKVKFGETTADGAITLEAVYCLGNCALSPAIMVDGRLVGRVDAARFEKIAAELTA
ncbi:MAG: formate dehydrogenase subunit gamma [Rhizobiales bacterium]|nr:formate dehydrogenase subunit gamma [Hyphomicrobiales bacterium]MBI3672377.1 formate dehydrogenase subunit gamma [Hyphomicrobiales bacterium]